MVCEDLDIEECRDISVPSLVEPGVGIGSQLNDVAVVVGLMAGNCTVMPLRTQSLLYRFSVFHKPFETIILQHLNDSSTL